MIGIKFKIWVENKCWTHAVEYNSIIFDNLGLSSLLPRYKGGNFKRQSKNSNITFWWWLETWSGLANSSLRWWIGHFTPHYFQLLDIWKSENFILEIAPMFYESNSTIPNFQTAPNAYSCLRLVVPPINSAWVE